MKKLRVDPAFGRAFLRLFERLAEASGESLHGLAKRLEDDSTGGRGWYYKLRRWCDGQVPLERDLLKALRGWYVRDPELVVEWLMRKGPEPAWLESGEPFARSDAPAVLDHRTPPLGTRVPDGPPVLDPQTALERGMEDLRSSKDPAVAKAMQKFEVAWQLLNALKAARNAGLAGVLIAGTMALAGCSRNSPQFGGELLSIEDVRRRLEEERRRHHSGIRASKTYARA